MMPGKPEEINMTDLPDNVKAELAKRVESRLMGFHVVSLLKMMLLKPDEKKEAGDKPKLLKEHDQDAKEAVAEIIDMVSQTVRTGKLPDKEAA
jgi:hypothetical protein